MKNIEHSKNFKDITGLKFGRLTAIECVGRSRDRKAIWLCVCDCGKKIQTTGKAMRMGKTLSCGCLQIERAKEANTTHGESKTKLHGVWLTMKSRTGNPKVFSYRYYGAKGIKICKEWLDFSKFRKWALENGYKSGLTIERNDVAKDYSPSNCRWIPANEQSKNRSNNIKYKGENAADASIRLGGKRSLVATRIRVYGWTLEKAFTTLCR